MIPDSDDPAVWLQAIDELEAEEQELALWQASKEVDGEAATIGRALDAALGRRPPLFVEVGDGQVLELGQEDGTGPECGYCGWTGPMTGHDCQGSAEPDRP